MIRRYIENGALAGAVLPDGTIDPDVADVKLAAAKIGGQQVSSGLVKARTRKLAAGVALLRDELAEIEAGAAPAAEVAEVVRRVVVRIAQVLWPIAALAPRLAGQERTAAIAMLDAEVRGRLEVLSSTRITGPRPKRQPREDGPALATMLPVDLAAMRAELQARRMELQRALRQGELVDLAKAQAAAVGNVLRARQKLLGLPAKAGAAIVDVADAAELAPVLATEVREALAELACDYVSQAEIEAARGQAIAEPSRLVFKLAEGVPVR